MRERGPVFVATFNPLCVVITAALGVVVLSESIHLGRYLFLLSKISIKFLDPFFFLSNKLCINLKPQKR